MRFSDLEPKATGYALTEAPINDFEPIGDFNKNSSFRKPVDRAIITNDKAVEKIRKKFANSNEVFDFYFVNSAKANKFTELGEVSLEWVAENLGQEVADKVGNETDVDAIKIIFTNNKGSEGVPMTAWIMGHRIGHVMRRGEGRYGRHAGVVEYSYQELSKEVVRMATELLRDYYGYHSLNISGEMKLMQSPSNVQLLYTRLMEAICTFKSAREHNLRNFFEVINELIAQYLTTGTIKFNPLPKSFKGVNRNTVHLEDVDYEGNSLDGYAESIEHHIANIFMSAAGKIYVM